MNNGQIELEENTGLPQWIYPTQLLNTPQSDFDFPEYPGLSVAMRVYIAVGKISCFLFRAILVAFNIIFSLVIYWNSRGGLEYFFLSLLLIIAVSFLILLLMNLSLAFQFGSCEIVKVLIRNEENTRTVKKLLEKQLLVMIKTKKKTRTTE